MPSTIGILIALTSLFLSAPSQPIAPGFANGVCTESPHVTDRPPDDPGSSSFASPGATWFANDARTIWAWWWGKRSAGDYKVLWIRPGMKLNVTGKRLDGEGAALKADIPDGYYSTFQASALDFSTAGCWQVDGTASGQSLRFVVKIP